MVQCSSIFRSMLRNCDELNYTIFREAAYLVKTMSETGTFINKDRQFKGYLLTRLTIKEDFVQMHFKCASPNIVQISELGHPSGCAGAGWCGRPAGASHRLSCRPGHYLLLMAPTQPPTSRAVNEPSGSFIVECPEIAPTLRVFANSLSVTIIADKCLNFRANYPVLMPAQLSIDS